MQIGPSIGDARTSFVDCTSAMSSSKCCSLSPAAKGQARAMDSFGCTPAPSHNIKPGRRRRAGVRFTAAWTYAQIVSVVVLMMLSICAKSEARSIKLGVDVRSVERLPAERGQILADRREEARGLVDLHANANVLAQRQSDDLLDLNDSEPSSSSSSSRPTSSVASRFSASSRATPSASSSVTTSAAATAKSTSSSSSSSASFPLATGSTTFNGPLPQPFDTSLGSNFTADSCPRFFKSFLNDQNFRSCYPFSLLLRNSQSFFRASRDPDALEKVLDAGCNSISAICQPLMASLSGQITANENCGADLSLQNPYVLAAYAGLVSYAPMAKAACIKASAEDKGGSSNEYCYSSASRNVDRPADMYLYTLPLGIDLPGSSRPTCSPCVKETMDVFAEAAQNLTSPLSKNYVAAATQVNLGCGPGFVKDSIKPIEGSSSSRSGAVAGSVPLSIGWLATVAMGIIVLVA